MKVTEAARLRCASAWFREMTEILRLFVAFTFFISFVANAQEGALKTLHAFQGTPDGATPQYVNLILDSKGNLWGTTRVGGKQNQGTVFKVDKKGSEAVFYSFTGGSF